MTNYTYISSVDYINNLTFDYVETYSFQRGSDYEENLKVIKSEYNRLKVRKERRNNLTEREQLRFSELESLLSFMLLINDKGQFHPSSKKTSSFQNGNAIVEQLINILKTEVRNIPMWMCAPIYRDAIVFYNQAAEIVSTLHVCLSCEYMVTKEFHHVNGDNEMYKLLKTFFIDIGHDVEDATKFLLK
ncbi:hypothetical protein [Solitalea canadensis]|uniref:Uncharacterized protein n=1 Tax=Solitalea canadensis (strain ATCC 29591 / DSM 3403 / JCM 21819 / LMG 8368 / NBRC 15130 / NCIMB 12057 / USAM 9D) TaxID=929556 RepID=H8KKW6_SOLCM|nr:hypothetical protein [Solitalea canadensis]AFD08599.1 hypothetical protein Solca_3595 [Solitalea canadensis DSM 3403]